MFIQDRRHKVFATVFSACMCFLIVCEGGKKDTYFSLEYIFNINIINIACLSLLNKIIGINNFI